ncbi:hypothetical protein AQUCO_14900002v1 [Aquilegia coerulea]|uniref:Uncharacterized protein n=1 Tax=Aquilegia coerulea TaxID=218851 RepID=A0A2G5C0X4_AQUCA|nr:hypothetical protein AQUCO_14900002v1 [Aquilegia coerulea]
MILCRGFWNNGRGTVKGYGHGVSKTILQLQLLVKRNLVKSICLAWSFNAKWIIWSSKWLKIEANAGSFRNN